MTLVGKIAVSKAGRDKGEYFAVIGETEKFLLLANGRKRPIEKPKFKKHKHVEVLKNELSEDLKSRISDKSVTNKSLYREIKKSLNSFFD
jgi:ribosomal protein L14E/L6E/L27E